jgi:hypothetical protein
MSGLSVGNLNKFGRVRRTIAATSTTGPNRPMNISMMRMIRVGEPSAVVTPVERPTVDKAETASNAAAVRPVSPVS